jgi:hypothetical protein
VDFYCRACGSLNTFDRNYLESSDACFSCKTQGRWTKVQPQTFEYVLTVLDRQMLKSFRIDPE